MNIEGSLRITGEANPVSIAGYEQDAKQLQWTFEQELQQQSTRVSQQIITEVHILTPVPDGLRGAIIDYLNSFYERYQINLSNTNVNSPLFSFEMPNPITHEVSSLPSEASPGLANSTAPSQAQQAIHLLERAYGFAIETTLISRGSTKATRIFNTLLKGQ